MSIRSNKYKENLSAVSELLHCYHILWQIVLMFRFVQDKSLL